MKPAQLKIAILIAVIFGVVGFGYILVSALGDKVMGPLDSYAVGEMADFKTPDSPPAQPTSEILTGEGETITLADKQGKVILVNFWATWCAPCLTEMPALDALQADLGSDRFEVVAVSMDRTIDAAREFYAQNNLTHLALYHDQSFQAALSAGGRGLPLTILYDPYGGEIGRLEGPAEWHSEEAIALIEAALARF
ncbi:TlpA family protein disulfide reductase [Woodsholea maritima]|uniref:TlpA family protein disulfide reductase n=1 Tax=Woodsholea maritima TaxID=240237 RepID=UPI000378F3EF|nr:TlpA disulfide reductase family protein [Woodsholea maritima]